MVRATSRGFTLDGASEAAFREAIGPLFEGAPRFLARLAAARPLGSSAAMFARAREIARAMPEAEQVELIDAHPRLGAPSGAVSEYSFREQGYDGASADVAATTPTEAEQARTAAELDRLNAAYERRFGFRYCVFVAGRPRAALLLAMEAALAADRSTEIARALDAIVDIAADRWEKEQ
ncbi:MAG: 2-oxo-4-hydroxy-4-carboxy-5-ureidoimidazoline decarboxylase [Candidatus Limnocylindrales bacterium]